MLKKNCAKRNIIFSGFVFLFSCTYSVICSQDSLHDEEIELDLFYFEDFFAECRWFERKMLEHPKYSEYLVYLSYDAAVDKNYFPCGALPRKVDKEFVKLQIAQGLFKYRFNGVCASMSVKKSKLADIVHDLLIDEYIKNRKFELQCLDDWRWEQDFQDNSSCSIS